MLPFECDLEIRCKKSVAFDYTEQGISKENSMHFRFKYDDLEVFKNSSKELAQFMVENIGALADKTEFDSKAEIQAWQDLSD